VACRFSFSKAANRTSGHLHTAALLLGAAAAEAYVRVGIAVTDAFIQRWYTKYLYNRQHPVTYIKDNIDGTWLPYIVTPSFPTYTPGHSSLYGGIHFPFDNDHGLSAGQCIGRTIIDRVRFREEDNHWGRSA
jgi:hypothetical protein